MAREGKFWLTGVGGAVGSANSGAKLARQGPIRKERVRWIVWEKEYQLNAVYWIDQVSKVSYWRDPQCVCVYMRVFIPPPGAAETSLQTFDPPLDTQAKRNYL